MTVLLNKCVCLYRVQCDCMTVHTVGAMGVVSARGMHQDKDKSGLTTYTAGASRRSSVIVLTEAGDIITADIMKTSPLPAMMNRVKRLGHRLRSVQASSLVVTAYLFIH